MPLKPKLIMTLAFVILLGTYISGCSVGSDMAPAPMPVKFIVSGTVQMPGSQSATATASLRRAVSYQNLNAHIFNSSGHALSDAVTVNPADGTFSFNEIAPGEMYRIHISSASGRILLKRFLDQITGNTYNLKIDSYSTVISTLVLESNQTISAAQTISAEALGIVSLTQLVSSVESWLSGRLTTDEKDVEKVLIADTGRNNIQNMINEIIIKSASGGDNQFYFATDTIFYPDAGFRTSTAANFSRAGMAPDGRIFLYHNNVSTGKTSLRISSDGINFSEQISENIDYSVHPGFLLMPDEKTRRSYQTESAFSPNVVSRSFIGKDPPAMDSGLRYSAQAGDNSSIGGLDVFTDDRGGLVMLYVGDPRGANDIRKAYSSPGNNGLSFAFSQDNVLGDAHLSQATQKNVDPFSILLPDGRRRLFTVSHGGTSVNSFISKDSGKSFAPEPGIRLTPGDFTRFKVYSLHEPTVVRIIDGRYRMYVTARIDLNSLADENAPDRYTSVIVSATTRLQ